MAYQMGGARLGIYPPTLAKFDKYAEALLNKFGVKYVIGVGVRTKEQQEDLYNRWIRGEYKCPVVAKPDFGLESKARHPFGLAADFRPNPMPRAHLDMARQFGLRADVPNEPWHIYDEDSARLIREGVVKALSNADMERLRLGAPSAPVSTPVEKPTQDVASWPLLRNNSDGGAYGKKLFEWLGRFYPDSNTHMGGLMAKCDLSTSWIADDKWAVLSALCKNESVGLLAPDEDLTLWGKRCWTAVSKLGFKY